MADLYDLYHEAVLDHYRNPRNRRTLAGANRQGEGFNPLCGDRITLFMQVAHGRIEDITFTGTGCAIAIASASIMTEILKGKVETEAYAAFARFQRMVADPCGPAPNRDPGDPLAVFSGIRGYPVRMKCASLAWQTMRAALENRKETVATE